MKNPSEQLHDIDYRNLKGENWSLFNSILEALPPDEMFDFVVYEAKPLIEKKGKGMSQKSKLMGVILLSEQPIQTTRISAHQAKMWNRQIESPQSQGTGGKIYLLKK